MVPRLQRHTDAEVFAPLIIAQHIGRGSPMARTEIGCRHRTPLAPTC